MSFGGLCCGFSGGANGFYDDEPNRDRQGNGDGDHRSGGYHVDGNWLQFFEVRTWAILATVLASFPDCSKPLAAAHLLRPAAAAAIAIFAKRKTNEAERNPAVQLASSQRTKCDENVGAHFDCAGGCCPRRRISSQSATKQTTVTSAGFAGTWKGVTHTLAWGDISQTITIDSTETAATITTEKGFGSGTSSTAKATRSCDTLTANFGARGTYSLIPSSDGSTIQVATAIARWISAGNQISRVTRNRPSAVT